jgi:hypothetical protein
MAAEDLAKLATDAPGDAAAAPKDETAAASADPAPAATAGDPMALNEPEPMFIQSFTMLATMLGNVVAARFNVPAFSPEEAATIGGAGALVLAQYDVKGNPKVIAWGALGAALVGPGWVRYQDYMERKAAPPPPAPVAADPPADPPPKMPPPGKGKGGKSDKK